MKRLTSLFFLLYCSMVFAGFPYSDSPEDNPPNTTLSIGMGKTAFPVSWGGGQRNPSFMVGYRKQYFNSFAFEGFYQYAQSNNFPDFFNDPDRLNTAILAGGIFDSTWDEIYLHSLGIKAHFVLSGRGRWFVSTYLAGGAFTAWSSYHSLTEAFFWGNQMVDYKSEHIKKRNNGLFYMPGLQVNYQVYRKYFLGFDLSLFQFIDMEKRDLITPYDFPVLPEYFNASLIFGLNF